MQVDVDTIRGLVELMVEHDLTRVEIQEGETRLLLRRSGAGAVLTPTLYAAPPAPAPLAPPGPTPAGAPSETPGETLIRSPMVGTFYTAPDPDSPAFVKPGDNVTADTVVCLIEAMKVFNEIKAEVSGRLTKALVKNGEAVEYDQPLFAVAAS